MKKISQYFPVIVIGSGMAGLGASIELKKQGVKHIILEKANTVGGLCSSTETAGVTFDIGPKILILDDSKNSKEILAFLNNNYVEYPVDESVYLSEYGMLSFPLQRNLIDLPKKIRQELINDILATQNKPKTINSFKDWLAASYGKKFCEMVLFPYEEKKWQHPLEEMDYEWALNRPVKVNIEEVIAGAKAKLKPNKRYFYPKKGSIAILTQAMAKKSGPIKMNQQITSIDLINKVLTTKDGIYNYERLISTMPLDSFIEVSKSDHNSFKQKSKDKLKRLEIVVLNLVFTGEYNIPGTAIYFPEKKFIFRRVSILKNICPSLDVSGKTSLQIEISVNPNNRKDISELLSESLSAIRSLEFFPREAELEGYESIRIPFAYPLQVNGMKELVRDIHEYHAELNVFHAGRGGSYDYCNSDEAYRMGKEAAHRFATGNKIIKKGT